METTPTPFDLNRAIEQWRAGLNESPAFRRENVDELEAHLRDSIANLRQRGLAEDEAFLIATRRAGSGAALGAEYGKINAREVWLNRVMWMLVGTLTFGLIESLIYPITELTVMLIFRPVWSTGDSYFLPLWVGLCAGCLYFLTLSGALWLAWKLLTRKNKTAVAWLKRVLTGSNRSIWIAASVCILIKLSQYFLRPLVMGMINRNVNNQAGGSYDGWKFITSMGIGDTVGYLAASSVLVLLALMLARRQLLAKTWA
jgi:hypothetical protein